MKMSRLEKCPVCEGRGFVKGNFYDVPGETCSFGDYVRKEQSTSLCRICNGTGISNRATAHDCICTDNANIAEETVEIIKKIYRKYSTGGALHIVLDDGNVDDGNILWCVQNSIPSEQFCDLSDRPIFEKCALNLIKIAEDERLSVIEKAMEDV